MLLAQGTTARPAPLAMSGKRKKTDEVDMEHLQDVLLAEGKRNGMEGAFNFGSYNVLTKQQAISGRDLASQCEFLEELKECSDQLLLKYINLKDAFTMVLRKHPVILARFDMAEREYKAGHFAKTVMTLCTHVRRLKDEKKFREACRGLPSFSVAKLHRLRNLVCTGDSPVGNVQAGKPSSSAAKVPGRDFQEPGNAFDSEHPGSEAEKPGKASGPEAQEPDKAASWEDILSMQLPATQESLSDGGDGLEAVNESPVPPRKKDVREIMKRPAKQVLRKPAAAAAAKKPAKKEPAKKAAAGETAKWFLMPYNEKKNWSVAVREKGPGGKQVVAVSKYGNRKDNWAAAEKLLKMLLAGKAYPDVQEAKHKL